jgi:LSD1 subclass zinc finger protein
MSCRIPLESGLNVVKCNSCQTKILDSAITSHLETCGKADSSAKIVKKVKISEPTIPTKEMAPPKPKELKESKEGKPLAVKKKGELVLNGSANTNQLGHSMWC